MESIFSQVTKLCQKHNAINLAQGFPDFETEPEIVEISKEVFATNVHQYAPAQGLISLREEIVKLQHQYYNVSTSSDNLLITSGATEALYATFLALIEEGDEVILFDPCYDSYVPAIEKAGGVCIRIPLLKPHFEYDWKSVEDKVSDRTKMIVINNPHNPLGVVLGDDDLKELKRIVFKHNLTLISDEVYEFISFKPHLSILMDEELSQRSVVISSFGKTLHLTGWKIGYLHASPKLMSKIMNVHQFLVFSVHHPSQKIIESYLKLKNHKVSPMEVFREKQKLVAKNLKDSRFKLLNCEGTYFQLLDYSEISSENDVNFVKSLIQDKGTGLIPISVFYEDNRDQNILRLCFAKNDDTLINATNILCKI